MGSVGPRYLHSRTGCFSSLGGANIRQPPVCRQRSTSLHFRRLPNEWQRVNRGNCLKLRRYCPGYCLRWAETSEEAEDCRQVVIIEDTVMIRHIMSLASEEADDRRPLTGTNQLAILAQVAPNGQTHVEDAPHHKRD